VCLLRNVQTGYGAHPVAVKRPGCVLTTHLHLVPRFLVGAIPLLPPYAFTTWTGTTVPLQFTVNSITRQLHLVCNRTQQTVLLLGQFLWQRWSPHFQLKQTLQCCHLLFLFVTLRALTASTQNYRITFHVCLKEIMSCSISVTT